MKEFSCPKCHCKRFWRRRVVELLVDFGRQGTLENHPMLEGTERAYTVPSFVCAECGFYVPMEMASEMEAEII